MLNKCLVNDSQKSNSMDSDPEEFTLKTSDDTLQNLERDSEFDGKELKAIHKEFCKQGSFKRRDKINSPEELLKLLTKLGLLSSLLNDWSGIESSDKSEKENEEIVKKQEKQAQLLLKDNTLAEMMGDTLFRALDSNDDKSIDFEELVIGRSILARGQREKKKAELHFKVCDRNGDGKLSKAELREVTRLQLIALRAGFKLGIASNKEKFKKKKMAFQNKKWKKLSPNAVPFMMMMV